MTVFSVRHITTYRYKNPVRPGLHQLMFRPRDSFDQRLLDCRMEVAPTPTEVRWIHDAFGNCVTLVDFAEIQDALGRDVLLQSVYRLDHAVGRGYGDHAGSVPHGLGAIGMKREQIAEMAELSTSVKRLLDNSPVSFDKEALIGILEEAY